MYYSRTHGALFIIFYFISHCFVDRVSEENFWRNYFYRVSLLRQQAELAAMEPGQPSNSGDVDPTGNP